MAVAATAAVAHNDNGKGKAKLDSYQEAPLTLSTAASGSFRIRVRSDGLHYTLKYSGFTTPVLQAHIHFGRTGDRGRHHRVPLWSPARRPVTSPPARKAKAASRA